MPRTFRARFILLSAVTALAACSSPGRAPEAVDGGGDAGPAVDAGPTSDAGPGDAGPGDAGVNDAGTCNPVLPTMGTTACRMCAENASACQADITTYQSDCSAYTTCLCGCDGGMTCPTTCRTDETTTCRTAIQGLTTCAEMACPTECAPPDAGTFPDGGNWCSQLAGCCATLDAGTLETYCDRAVDAGNDAKCAQTFTAAQMAGDCQ